MTSLLLPLDEMLLLLSSWALVAGIQCGWGFGLLRLGRLHTTPSIAVAFWIGLAGIIAFLQVWHLVLPVSGIAAVTVLVIGLFGFISELPTLRGMLSAHRPALLWTGVAGLLALLAANNALRPPLLYDNGLYHLQAIQWAQEYPIVPGLGNLHGRLAFNSAYFLVAALWDDMLWRFSGSQVLNGMLTLAVAFHGLGALANAFRMRRVTPSSLLSMLLLYPLINLLFDPLAGYLSGPTTDYVVWLLSLKLGMEAFRFLNEPLNDSARAAEIAALTAALIVIKLSGAVFALSMVAILVVVAWRRRLATPRRLMATIALVSLVAIAPWVVRTIILSGYPVYPSTVLALPVEWRVSVAQALDDTNFVRSWARYPVTGSHWRDVLANWEWLVTWQENFWRTRGIRLSTTLGALTWGAVVIAAVLGRKLPATARTVLAWSLPSVVSLFFWFFSAPDPRFALAYFWLIALGGVVALASVVRHLPVSADFSALTLKFTPDGSPKMRRLFPVTEVVIALGLSAFIILSHGFHWQSELVPLPTAEVRPYETVSGFDLTIPTSGELCWDAALPCTPYPKPELRLREAGNLGAGFTVQPLP